MKNWLGYVNIQKATIYTRLTTGIANIRFNIECRGFIRSSS